MVREIPNLQNDFINIQDHRYSNNIVMERNNRKNISFRGSPATVPEKRSKHELRRSFSSQKRLMIPANYFGLESLILLVGLTASLLVLPLILPPLPPPPFMLLLIPIGIMVLLVVLAFMPPSSTSTTSNAKDGTRDFAKEEMIDRRKVFSTIESVLERHGATALDTPDFELRETLRGKYGEDDKLIYDLADQGGELCCLRYDLTVPFARYVAMNKLTSFRRYQIAKVHRRDNPSKGRFREFYQCDFDIAGLSTKMGPDFEVVKILTELLDELQIGDYEIKLSHRKLLDGILKKCGVPPEKFRTICSSIDKLDKLSFDQVKEEMVEEKGLSSETADKIGTYVTQRGAPMELLKELEQEETGLLADEASKEALEDLSILFDALQGSNCINRIVFDLSLARGLDYYTGVIFEAVCIGAEVGSIGAGGRYDNLIGTFVKEKVSVPAVGVSLGIERVFTILEDLKKQQKQEIIRSTGTQVLVSVIADNKLAEAAKLASPLWAANIKTEFLLSKRQTKHFDYARKCGIPWMVVVDKTGLEKGVVTLKKIAEGSEEEYKDVPIDSFDNRLLELL